MSRFWEIFPGAAAWLTLLVLLALSWRLPAVVVVFILFYDLYWLLRVVYFMLHLSFSFRKMRANLKVNWLAKLEREKSGEWERLFHLVILPMYREPLPLVRRSLLSLIGTNYPKDRFLVVIATEERGGPDDALAAEKISAEFGRSFGGLLVTRHPAAVPGEVPGKGSNEAWAAREAVESLIKRRGIDPAEVLISVFDADTRPGPDYFGVLAHAFLTEPGARRASFQPIPLFANNLEGSPFVANIAGFSSTFWQLMQGSREEQLVTFSSHSMPLAALIEVGFWETDVVSEDSRIFFQCLAHFRGDWRTTPLFYPVSMDAVSGNGLWDALKNLYRQQRRWGWGVENVGRFVRDTRSGSGFPRRLRRFWIWVMFDGFYSWATSAIVIFLFGWLPNVLGGAAFNASVIAYNLPRMTGWILNFSSIGIIALALWSVAVLRLGVDRAKINYPVYLLGWILTPFVTVIFGAVPALEAQTRLLLGGKYRLGFWKTPKTAKSPLEINRPL